jgi:hypothetical protein
MLNDELLIVVRAVIGTERMKIYCLFFYISAFDVRFSKLHADRPDIGKLVIMSMMSKFETSYCCRNLSLKFISNGFMLLHAFIEVTLSGKLCYDSFLS